MLSYIVRRILATIPVILLISLLVFMLVQAAPGDPADLLLSDEATKEDIDDARKRWGLDQPIHVQYGKFLIAALQGDLGTSFRYTDPVVTMIVDRLPATIELAVVSILIVLIVGVPLGVWAGARPNSWIDNVGSFVGFFGISMPNFWFGIMLILVVSGYFNLLPSAGRSTYGVGGPPITGFFILDNIIHGDWNAVRDGISYIILPAVALGTNMMGILMRVTRSSVLEVMHEDFVRTARAKGVRDTRRTVAPRRPQRADPHHHRRRARTRHASIGLHHRRDRLFMAGQRLLADLRDHQPRLPADHGHCSDLYARLRDHQLHYRHSIWNDRSEDPF